MTKSADTVERRKVRSLARRYRREGYRVEFPDRGGAVPSFLDQTRPDLIAESASDNVVIQVKRGDKVRGANDMVEIAERVARQPGWRFELVTVRAPALQTHVSADVMRTFTHELRRAMDAGLLDLAHLSALALVEQLLTEVAVANHLKVQDSSARNAEELVVQGVIPTHALKTLDEAALVRKQVFEGAATPQRTAEAIGGLLELANRLCADAPGQSPRHAA